MNKIKRSTAIVAIVGAAIAGAASCAPAPAMAATPAAKIVAQLKTEQVPGMQAYLYDLRYRDVVTFRATVSAKPRAAKVAKPTKFQRVSATPGLEAFLRGLAKRNHTSTAFERDILGCYIDNPVSAKAHKPGRVDAQLSTCINRMIGKHKMYY